MEQIFGKDCIYQFDDELKKKVEDFVAMAEKMPGVVIIQTAGDFPVVYLSRSGRELLGLSLREVQEMGAEYHSRYFNIDYHNDLAPKLHKLLQEKSPDEYFTFFQQVKLKDRDDWAWYISCTRIFAFDKQGEPLLFVTVAVPIDGIKHVEAKAERLLKENMFIKKNMSNFLMLTTREKEIVKLVAIGKSSKEISEELFLAPDTVNTHRRNIKRKLNISSNYEFTEYAQAFDLIPY